MQPSQQSVLITGGSSGIGLALAQRFLQNHNTVIVTGRDLAKLADIGTANPGLITVQADMTDLSALQRLAQTYPNISVLINNAGVQYNYDLSDPVAGLGLIESELATNLVGPIQLIKLFLPGLMRHEQAAIVNVTSGLAYVPKQSAPVYCASKAGLHTFTKALRWQLEASNVRVFELIAPLTETPMTAGRGRSKSTPAAVAAEFWEDFLRDRAVMPIGRSKTLLRLQSIAPALADRIMRPGL